MGHENFQAHNDPQDVHKEIHIILLVPSAKTIRNLCWAVKISSIRKAKEISNFLP